MAITSEDQAVFNSEADDKLYDELVELSRNEQNEEVIAFANRYLKTPQARSDPWMTHTFLAYKALAQFDIKQKTQARKTAMRACDLFPNCPWAQFVLALILEDLARDKQDPHYFEEAMAACQYFTRRTAASLRKSPCCPKRPAAALCYKNDVKFLLAFLHIEKGRKATARKLLKQYLEAPRSVLDGSHFVRAEARQTLRELESRS